MVPGGGANAVYNLADLGAPARIVAEARAAHSAGAVLALAGKMPLGDRVAVKALGVVQENLGNAEIAVDVAIFDRAGTLIGRAGLDDGT